MNYETDKDTINPSNVYDELDRLDELKRNEERKIEVKKLSRYKLNGIAIELIKLFLLILLILSPFIIKHSFPDFYSRTIENTEIKIMKTIGLEKEDSTKSINKKDIIVMNNNDNVIDNQSIDVPEITITGIIEQNSYKYVIFKFNNKIYTEKVGDRFSDNTYEIIGISDSFLKIKDFNGNIFKIPIKLKK